MAIAELTGQRATTSSGSTSTTLTLAYPGNVTAGNVLVVGGSVVGNPSYARPSISATGTGAPTTGWRLIVSPGRAGTTGGDARSFIAYAEAGASDACTVSLALNGLASFASYSITEFSGASLSLANTAAAYGTSTDPQVSVAAVSGALVLGCAMWRLNTSGTPDGAWVQIGEIENWSTSTTHNLVRQIASSTTTWTPDWTVGSSADWAALAVVLSETSSSGGASSYPFVG